MAGNPLHSRLMQVHPVIGRLLDSAMAGVAPDRFIILSGLLRDYSGPAFVDATGHNTEEVVPTIVAALLPAIRNALPVE